MNDKYRQYADDLLEKASAAASEFRSFDQVRVDKIVSAAFRAAYDARIPLAEDAARETGMGIVRDKILKNSWASLILYDSIKNIRTVGVVSEDRNRGIVEIAQPRGPILAFTPITNPTSTAIFKILIALKTRNPLIFSPHRRAKKCTIRAAELMYEAARKAGAPENCIQWIRKSRYDYITAVMTHERLALILATGSPRVVNMAQASGTPALGVGAGNVPAYVHKSASFPLAADYIFLSKTFDNGTVCASEQAVVVGPEVDARLRPLFERKGAYFCSADETTRLGDVVFDRGNGTMRPEVVGQPATRIAEMAGLDAPPGVTLLIAELDAPDPRYNISHEILAPVLAWFVVLDKAEALETCETICNLGGEGHTLSIFANNEDVVKEFASGVAAGRILLNSPSTHGAIGGIFNSLDTSFTLSCGAGGGNITMDNISVRHLLEYQRIARRRLNHKWFALPEGTLENPRIDSSAIMSIYGRNF